MTTEREVEAPKPGRRIFGHGESVVGTMGFAVAAIVLAAVAATSWWTMRTQRRITRAHRTEQLKALSVLLAQSAEALMAGDELSFLRRLVSETGLHHDLVRCRITLPDGRVVAAADPSRIGIQKLPEQWPAGRMGPASESATRYRYSIYRPLHIPGRGSASLEIVAPMDSPGGSYWEAEAGVGAIGVGALAALLLVYRWVRKRFRALAAIREALLCYRQEGAAATDALSVSAALGPEAEAWNRLLGQNKELRKQVAVERAKESLQTTRGVKGDLPAACDALPQGIILVDEKGRAKFVNGAAAVFLRARRDDIVGADLAEYIKDPSVLESIRATASGSVCRRTTVELERGDGGGEGVLRFSVRPLRAQDATAAVIIIEDVTQQRVAEEARNAFVAQATHELRTPLTNIRLYVETALEEGENDPALRAKCLNVINQESRRLERMVGDILSVAEIEAGSFKLRQDDVPLGVMFQELQADYAAQAAEKEIELTFDLPPKLPVITGDRDKIALALHNLIGNALKYTPAGGEVTVTMSAGPNELVVEVADTGIGISQEDQQRIFRKFYRAKDSRVAKITGSGLGLALAREVIRLHGGDITVQSELDKGSTFTLTLPVVAEAPRHADSRATAGSGHRT